MGQNHRQGRQAGRLFHAMQAKQTLRHARWSKQLCGCPGGTVSLRHDLLHGAPGRRQASILGTVTATRGNAERRRCSAPRAPRPHCTPKASNIVVTQGHPRELVAPVPKVDLREHPHQALQPSSESTMRRRPAGGANQRAYLQWFACSLGRGRGHSARPCHHARSRAVARSMTALVSTSGRAALS
jgi:hypothetical protein